MSRRRHARPGQAVLQYRGPTAQEMDEYMIGIFQTPFSTLLRPPRHMPDIREIEIAYCPAERRRHMDRSRSTLTTVEEFNAVVSELAQIH